eukprot:m51a1_g4804 hypothetical protein (285) ;mRNA; f:117148-118140
MATTRFGDLETLALRHSSSSTCVVALQGAHVLSFTDSHGRELLFLSSRAVYAKGKAIRGGIPVVFPHFGPWGKLPQHGFARTSLWRVSAAPSESAGVVTAALALGDSEATRALWPHAFELSLRLELGADRLQVELSCRNTGAEQFDFTCALHTYFCVADARRAAVRGLRGLRYAQRPEGEGTGAEETTFAGPFDRTYFGAPPSLTIASGDGTSVAVASRSFTDAVVWNPCAEGAAKMADMGPDDWQRFVCVEAAVVKDPVVLGPGMTWSGSQSFGVSDAPHARL